MILVVLVILSIGGVVAKLKRDYFSRGIAIFIMAGIPGLLAMLLSPKSKARMSDENDEHRWPPYGPLAFVLNIILIVIAIVWYWA